jgi:hypothetical protein
MAYTPFYMLSLFTNFAFCMKNDHCAPSSLHRLLAALAQHLRGHGGRRAVLAVLLLLLFHVISLDLKKGNDDDQFFWQKVTPTSYQGKKIFSHFICTTCFHPELGPIQVLFTTELSLQQKTQSNTQSKKLIN